MTQYTIQGRLRLLAGLSDEDALAALPLCEAAQLQLLTQLKPRANRSDPRLTQAAAAMALVLLTQSQSAGDDDFASFRAGDVAVTKGGRRQTERLAQAEALRRQALEDCRELLRDTGFFAGTSRF